MQIAPAALEDVPDLVALINRAYRGETSKKGWTTEAHLLDGNRTDEDHLSSVLAKGNGFFLKCTEGTGTIIACAHLEKQENRLYLGMLTVSPGRQGAGIGKQLLAAAEQEAKRQHCGFLYMTVISVRLELIAWYERHGYAKTGEQRAFPSNERFGVPRQPLKLVLLEKAIY